MITVWGEGKVMDCLIQVIARVAHHKTKKDTKKPFDSLIDAVGSTSDRPRKRRGAHSKGEEKKREGNSGYFGNTEIFNKSAMGVYLWIGVLNLMGGE